MIRITLNATVLLLLCSLAILSACGGTDTGPRHAGEEPEDESKAGHVEDDAHAEGTDARVVHLEQAEIDEFGIQIAEAGPGELRLELVLPGEVNVNPDSVAHITPRVPGVVREVFKNLGDEVVAGELLAVLDSRELAEAKAAFLAARETLALAQSNLERETYLYDREISSQQEFLEAKQAEAKARIAFKSAEQHLHALGLDEEEVARLKDEPDVYLTQYEIRAPIAGVIVEKHVTRGEMLRDDSMFVIADLSMVWIALTVYQKDLASIHSGQAVRVTASHDLVAADAAIDYVSPILDSHTRSTSARVVLANDEGRWRPGLFVTGRVVVERVHADVIVPKTAIQTLDEQPVVFVKTGHEFEARRVRLGREDASSVEILSGLEPGDRYVASGGFALKAEMNKASFGHAGHAH